MSPQPVARATGCCRQEARQCLIDGLCVTSSYPSTRRTLPRLERNHSLDRGGYRLSATGFWCICKAAIPEAIPEILAAQCMVNVDNMNSHNIPVPKHPCYFVWGAPLALMSSAHISKMWESNIRIMSLWENSMQVASFIIMHKCSQCSLLASLARVTLSTTQLLLADNQLLDEQCGFRPNRSTIDALFSLRLLCNGA